MISSRYLALKLGSNLCSSIFFAKPNETNNSAYFLGFFNNWKPTFLCNSWWEISAAGQQTWLDCIWGLKGGLLSAASPISNTSMTFETALSLKARDIINKGHYPICFASFLLRKKCKEISLYHCYHYFFFFKTAQTSKFIIKFLTIRPWRGPRCGSFSNVGHRRPQLCGRWHVTRDSHHRRSRLTSCGCAASYCGLFCWHAKRWDHPLNASHDDCAWNAGRYTSPYHCPLKIQVIYPFSNFKSLTILYKIFGEKSSIYLTDLEPSKTNTSR